MLNTAQDLKERIQRLEYLCHALTKQGRHDDFDRAQVMLDEIKECLRRLEEELHLSKDQFTSMMRGIRPRIRDSAELDQPPDPSH